MSEKDKIKAKIKELEEQKEKMKYDGNRCFADYEQFCKNLKFFKEQIEELSEESTREEQYTDFYKDLCNKQQKEIEKIKDKNKTLEGLLQGNLFELYLYYKELASKYQANSISKDKIREKIKEITNYDYTSVEERDCQVYARQVLKELLEENTNEWFKWNGDGLHKISQWGV